jgi:hypothetical protein
MWWKLGIAASMMVFVAAGVSQANTIGNPVPDTKSGEGRLQISYSSANRDVTGTLAGTSETETFQATRLTAAVGFGVSDRGMLGFQAGTLHIDPDSKVLDPSNGTAVGVFYRHIVGESGQLKHGLSFAYTYGYAGNDTSDTYLYIFDVAYGVSIPASDKMTLYAAAWYSSLSGTVDLSEVDVTIDLEGKSSIGAVAGAEFKAGANLIVGAEVRAAVESGFAAFVRFGF